MSERLAIFAEGLFESHSGKTAHGVIRYGNRDVVAVVDSTNAGRTAAEIEPFCVRDVPVVAGVAEAIERGATTLLIGVAPTGGKLDPAWRPALLEAIEAGLDLEAGLHTELSADPELREAAERRGTRLRDLRAAPPDLTVPLGPASRAAGVRVVHSVGSDTVIGKKVVTLELDRAARAARARVRVRAHRADRRGDRGLGPGGGPRDLRLRGRRGRAAREPGLRARGPALRRGPGGDLPPGLLGRHARPPARLGARRAGAGAQGRSHRAAQLPGPPAARRCPSWWPPTRRSPGRCGPPGWPRSRSTRARWTRTPHARR